MFLVVVDAYSKWPEVRIATPNRTGTINASKYLCTVLKRWGLPEKIVTDNGPQFTSIKFRDFIFPYNPQMNGQAERMVQTYGTNNYLKPEHLTLNWLHFCYLTNLFRIAQPM